MKIKHLMVLIVFLLMVGSAMALVDSADLPVESLDVPPVEEEIVIDRILDKGKAIPIEQRNPVQKIFGQPFAFVDSGFDSSSCFTQTGSHLYRVYRGGVNIDNQPIQAGSQCEVGEYIRYYSHIGAGERQDIFADLWYKSSSSDNMIYAEYIWTNGLLGEPNIYDANGIERFWASYSCYICDVPEEERIVGCLDRQASNYDPQATVSSGSCEYDEELRGCTEPLAVNYNPRATINDGSCSYEQPTTTDVDEPEPIDSTDDTTTQEEVSTEEEEETDSTEMGVDDLVGSLECVGGETDGERVVGQDGSTYECDTDTGIAKYVLVTSENTDELDGPKKSFSTIINENIIWIGLGAFAVTLAVLLGFRKGGKKKRRK